MPHLKNEKYVVDLSFWANHYVFRRFDLTKDILKNQKEIKSSFENLSKCIDTKSEQSTINQ